MSIEPLHPDHIRNPRPIDTRAFPSTYLQPENVARVKKSVCAAPLVPAPLKTLERKFDPTTREDHLASMAYSPQRNFAATESSSTNSVREIHTATKLLNSSTVTGRGVRRTATASAALGTGCETALEAAVLKFVESVKFNMDDGPGTEVWVRELVGGFGWEQAFTNKERAWVDEEEGRVGSGIVGEEEKTRGGEWKGKKRRLCSFRRGRRVMKAIDFVLMALL